MSTYLQIRAKVAEYGVRGIADCHIAQVKAYWGLTRGIAPTRFDPLRRVKPCPASKWGPIERALRELGHLK